MAKRRWLFLVTATILLSTAAPAQSEPCWYKAEPGDLVGQSLCTARTLRCEFPDGQFANWDKGDLSIAPTTTPMRLIFDNVDVGKQTGRVIGNQGGENILAVGGVQVLHLLEQTGTGNMNMTSVFASADPKTGFLRAVHSRHIHIRGPIPSQYYGTCEATP